MGTVHVLEAARAVPSVRGVVVVTSDKCYENRDWTWAYRETEAMGGHDPYSSSKGCAELVAAAYRRSFFSGIATARAGNVIGGGDWAEDRLLPDCIRALTSASRSRSGSLPRCGRGSTCWSRCAAICCWRSACARTRAAFGEAWNFGPADEDARPVGWIASFVVRAMGRTGAVGGGDPHRTARKRGAEGRCVARACAAGLGATVAAGRRRWAGRSSGTGGSMPARRRWS